MKKIWPTYFSKKPTTDSNSLISIAFGQTLYDIVLSLIYPSVSPQNSIQNFEKLAKKSSGITFGWPWIWLVSFRVPQSDWSILWVLQSDWSVLGSFNLIRRFYEYFNLIGQFIDQLNTGQTDEFLFSILILSGLRINLEKVL